MDCTTHTFGSDVQAHCPKCDRWPDAIPLPFYYGPLGRVFDFVRSIFSSSSSSR